MKKILLITKQKSGGGGFKSSREFANALKVSENNSIQFFTEEEACKNKFVLIKISIFNLINKYAKVFYGKKNNKITNTIPQIFKCLEHEKYSPNIILTHYIYEFLSLRDIVLFKKPILIFINDMWFFSGIKHFFKNSLNKKPKINKFTFFEILNYFSWLFKNKYLSQNKKIIFVASSEWLKKKAIKSYMLKNHKIEKINTPVDIKFWKKLTKNKCRLKLGLPLNKKLLLFVAKGGFNNYRKGGDIFLNIINYYRDNDSINFVILGQKSQNTKKSFFFDIRENEKKLRNLYNAVDLVFCLSRHENIPYSMIESMSCGVPNVSIDVGGVKEAIVHKKNGWILKKTDKESIKKSLNWCLSKKNYPNLSKNSTTHIHRNFSYDKILSDYNNLQKKNKL